MKQEQIHDALNLLDDDLIEAVDALRDKAGISGEFLKERSRSQKSLWMKYMPVAACLCVVVLGMLAWQHYRINILNNDTCDGVGNTIGNDEDLDGMVNSDGLTGGPSQGLDGVAPDGTAPDEILDGAVEGSVSLGEVPSVLVRIDEWQENGFKGSVAGIVDTDIFAEGTKIQVIFNENISVGIEINGGMKFETGVPDKADFPIGSIVRVQFVKFEHATEDATDITGQENIIYAELIAPKDSGNK